MSLCPGQHRLLQSLGMAQKKEKAIVGMQQQMMENIRHTHSPEQVEAIIGTVEREQQEVLDTIERDGGDLDEIIAKVRTKTRERQMEILQELESDSMQEAEIISDKGEDSGSKQ